eukprot:427651_1
MHHCSTACDHCDGAMFDDHTCDAICILCVLCISYAISSSVVCVIAIIRIPCYHCSMTPITFENSGWITHSDRDFHQRVNVCTNVRIDIIICGLCYRNYSNSVLSLLLDHSFR